MIRGDPYPLNLYYAISLSTELVSLKQNIFLCDKIVFSYF